jgi:uncharacterized YigZ family protein
MLADEYLTVQTTTRGELKVLGSRFIATVMPASTKEEAEQLIADVAKEFYDATHNCFAYRLGFDNNTFRYSDAGEPAGTAGKRILAAIDSKNLTDVVVVVTRYFGGTKLGIGGLSRAYFEATVHTLEQATIVKKIIEEQVSVTFSYDLTNVIMRAITLFQGKILESNYSNETTLRVAIRASKMEQFKKQIIEVTAGKVILIAVSDYESDTT